MALVVFYLTPKSLAKLIPKRLCETRVQKTGQQALDEARFSGKGNLESSVGPSHRIREESWCESSRPAAKHLIQICGLCAAEWWRRFGCTGLAGL